MNDIKEEEEKKDKKFNKKIRTKNILTEKI